MMPLFLGNFMETQPLLNRGQTKVWKQRKNISSWNPLVLVWPLKKQETLCMKTLIFQQMIFNQSFYWTLHWRKRRVPISQFITLGNLCKKPRLGWQDALVASAALTGQYQDLAGSQGEPILISSIAQLQRPRMRPSKEK